jgi:hypothetical protein
MSWRDREGLRREVLRHVLPDRPVEDRGHPGRPSSETEPRRFEDEWATGRLSVQPSAIFGAAAAQTWPVEADDIEEDAAGTYYSDWCEIEGGPVAQGLFSLPGFAVSAGEGTATVYAEIFDEDDETETTDALAVLTSKGATGTLSVPVFFELSGGKTIVKVRWKVVLDSGSGLKWSLGGSDLTYYGRA